MARRGIDLRPYHSCPPSSAFAFAHEDQARNGLVWTKISVDEAWDDGINLDEVKIFIPEVAKLVDAIEISAGTIVDNVFMMTRGEMPIGTLRKGI